MRVEYIHIINASLWVAYSIVYEKIFTNNYLVSMILRLELYKKINKKNR